jgi:multiple sugar transport system substrate-binding protein
MTRRQSALCLFLALIAGFAGCNKSDSTSSSSGAKGGGGGKSITIWWAQWAPSDGLAKLGKEFEKETGVAVNVTQIPWTSYQDKVFLDFANNKTSFDIVVGDSQWIGRGATQNLYVDLSDWLPKNVDMKTVHPVALKYLCEYPTGSGKYFAAPCETDAVGIAYRKDWFEDAKEKDAFKAKYGRDLAPPNTWDEYKQVAEFFTRADQKRYGCAILTGREYDSLVMGVQQFVWDWGGSWGDPKDMKVDGVLNTPGAAEGLTFAKDLMKFAPPGATNYSYDKCLEAFKNGSVAMTMDYFAFFPGIVSAMGDKAAFSVVPGKDDQNHWISLGGQGMSISTKTPTEQQELAKQFIAWFLKTENQQKWIQQEAGFTANVEILKSDAFRKATPYNAPFADSLDHLRDFWNVPRYNDLLAAAVKHMGAALDGTEEPKAALDALAKEHEAIVKEGQ